MVTLAICHQIKLTTLMNVKLQDRFVSGWCQIAGSGCQNMFDTALIPDGPEAHPFFMPKRL